MWLMAPRFQSMLSCLHTEHRGGTAQQSKVLGSWQPGSTALGRSQLETYPPKARPQGSSSRAPAPHSTFGYELEWVKSLMSVVLLEEES